MSLQLFTFQLLVLYTTYILITNAVTVNTTYGPVTGTVIDDVNWFIGIPFAKPPVDELRFASPEPPDSWTNPLELDVNSSVCCLQTTYNWSSTAKSEDCLYLNVLTPLDAAYMTTNYSVMVWIHGGSFEYGCKTEWSADPSTMMEEIDDVIIVSINYRIGLLGWLYDNAYGTGSILVFV